jgi:hypothetical protein
MRFGRLRERRTSGYPGAILAWTERGALGPRSGFLMGGPVIVAPRVPTVHEARRSTLRKQDEHVLYSLPGTICTS